MKKILLCFTLLIFHTNLYSLSIENKDNSMIKSAPSSIFLLDKLTNLNDSEVDLLNRSESYDLNGNVEKSIEYIQDLIKSFISQDKQVPAINAAMLLVEKMIMNNNLHKATILIRDIESRINYYLVTTKEIQEELLLRTAVYKYLITTLSPSNYKGMLGTVIESLKQIIANPKNKNGQKTIMLSYFALALAYDYTNEKKKALEAYYNSTKIANAIFDFYFYYVTSSKIIDIFLEQKEYRRALNRLATLHQLFSNIRFSSYYKIKIFLYIAEIYKLENKKLQALSILERSYELASSNHGMSDVTKKELIRNIKAQLKETYEGLPKEEQAIKKDSFILYNMVVNP